MKIFEYKDGETTWVLAKDLTEAMALFDGSFGNFSYLDSINLKEVPKDEWKDMYLLDINEPEPDEDDEEYDEDNYHAGYLIIENFEEYVNRSTSSGVIACTEY